MGKSSAQREMLEQLSIASDFYKTGKDIAFIAQHLYIGHNGENVLAD